MNDENLHITPDPHKGFPEPEIPANEAWNNMAAILDAEMPVSPPDSVPSQKPPSSGGGGITGSGIQFWSIGLMVLGVAGVVTWAVLHYSDKPSPASNIKPPATNENRDTKMDLQQKPVNRNMTVQTKVIPQSESFAKNEQPPALTFSSVSRPVEPKTKDIVPATPGTENTIAVVENSSSRQPVAVEKSLETVKNEEIQSNPTTTDAAPGESSDNPVPIVNPAVNSEAEMKGDNTQNSARDKKSGNSLRMSENLSWLAGVSGNIGAVVQKGRNPNLFYGGMVTGGLWHKKLKAGIETGIGWTVYNDYGSVLKNVRITDSISGDTTHPVIQYDTTRISSSGYRYQYLQIPLFISKQIVGKGKFAFDIRTGPVIGILISQKQISGSTSGPENGEILSTSNNDYTRLKISWQWDVMLQLRWNFSDRLSFTLSPSAVFYLNNLYESTNRPASMPCGIGVTAGLIYKFK